MEDLKRLLAKVQYEMVYCSDELFPGWVAVRDAIFARMLALVNAQCAEEGF